MRFAFPVVKLLDKQDELPFLLESDNVALVTAAHLLTRQTRQDPTNRYKAKLRLIRILFARGWERQRILDLFSVIDWLMHLPDELEQKLDEKIRQIGEEHKMPSSPALSEGKGAWAAFAGNARLCTCSL
ncbi:hypothetical protein [Desulfonatronum parangueonense]